MAGERCLRGSLQVHKGNGKGATIPALVRNLTYEEAIEFMTIENLQREDLNELEDARAFQTYLTLKGTDAVEDLASTIGVDPRYIRRRVRVLNFPKKALDLWAKGAMRYGHLEQFLRLGTKQEVLEATPCYSWQHAATTTLTTSRPRLCATALWSKAPTGSCRGR